MTPRNSNEEITPKKMFLLHIRYNFSIFGISSTLSSKANNVYIDMSVQLMYC